MRGFVPVESQPAQLAVSRAQALAIVVGPPPLLDVRCRSVEEMELMNLVCHLVEYTGQPA